ncbi:FecR family protein [Cyclobacterium qasimii]|uniref:FecR family protein n=1 Tax=Cyclobacterium qasimii TaxID=1350429 RepID=UPI001FD512D2|nr:FecR domain-containing protein [Cyclobacterium qasimii]
MKKELVIKFLKGESSPIEEQRIFQWLENPDAWERFEKLMEEQFENPTKSVDNGTDYTRLLGKIHERVLPATSGDKRSFQLVSLKSFKVAASLILVLLGGYFLSQSGLKRNEKTIPPSNPIKSIERITGIGEKLTLTMPDGTRIIVNSESAIQFNSDYGRIDRVVALNGEAYFDVVPDSLKPFKVEANGATTLALGTAFNISTKNTGHQVALTEGRVKVEVGKNTVHLTPGQMAVWDPAKQATEIQIQDFNVEKVTAWKDGRLAFERESLGRIIEDLEIWYGVTFKIDPNLDITQRISGSFENKNLKNILTGLSFSTAFSFELNGKKVHLTKRL